MRCVGYEAGGAEKLKIINTSVPIPTDKEVLIRVSAFGINRADILQREGKYPPPPGASTILGLEVAGTVEAISEDCSKKCKIGDRVMALLSGGGYAEYVTVHENLVMPIPAKLSFPEAAAIPENWITAYQLLHLVGTVKTGDYVLIHAAGSGVGLAAIQLAVLAGAKPIATAGTEEKLNKALSLGAIAAFNYKIKPFAADVLDSTSGHGVNLVLDCVGESFWQENVEALAVDGRWVLYGLLSGPNVTGPFLAAVLRKRIKLVGSTLRARCLEYRTDLIQSFTRDVLPAINDGKLAITIDNVFPLDKISSAHEHMEKNANTGKIVVVINPENH